MPASVVVFDAYGTLFDVSAAARRAAEAPGREALAAKTGELAQIWREKQVGYSWWRAITGTYTPFWEVTAQALDHALEATGLDGDPELRAALLALYHELDAYAEVPDMLSALKARGIPAAILSNGSPEMLDGAVSAAGIGGALDAVLSVAEVKTFKPSSTVYDMVGARYGCGPGDVLFISSNGWDVCAAAGYGFRTAWVNRVGAPREQLPFQPDRVIDDLTPVPGLAGTA